MPQEEDQKGKDARFICYPAGRDRTELLTLEIVMFTIIGVAVLISMFTIGFLISVILPNVELGKNAVIGWVSLLGVLFLVMSLYLVFNLLVSRDDPDEVAARGLEVSVSDKNVMITDRTGIWQKPNMIPMKNVIDVEKPSIDFFESRAVNMPLIFRPILQMAPRPKYLAGSFYPRKTIFDYLIVLHMKDQLAVRRDDDNSYQIVKKISLIDPTGSMTDVILVSIRPDDQERFMDLVRKGAGIRVRASPPPESIPAEAQGSESTSEPS